MRKQWGQLCFWLTDCVSFRNSSRLIVIYRVVLQLVDLCVQNRRVIRLPFDLWRGFAFYPFNICNTALFVFFVVRYIWRHTFSRTSQSVVHTFHVWHLIRIGVQMVSRNATNRWCDDNSRIRGMPIWERPLSYWPQASHRYTSISICLWPFAILTVSAGTFKDQPASDIKPKKPSDYRRLLTSLMVPEQQRFLRNQFDLICRTK